PLSNLDAKLRERMRHELRRLQREVGITSVYVTHDQAEAMIISDRIIVMNHGRIEQEGDARTLYTQPASAFVATFVGVANLVCGVVQSASFDRARVGVLVTLEGRDAMLIQARAPAGGQPSGDVWLSIRPEDIVLHRSPPADRLNVLPGRIETVGYLGNLVEYQVLVAGRAWRVQTHPSESFGVGEGVALELPPDRGLCRPADGAVELAAVEQEAAETLRA